ncbi:MAG: chemotaxis protein CheW [Candidatus Delongbacteria bacterium]|nr:chemotaxis protein CheW [Candidatus Delongbacteria bacterium]MDD4204475.1 chemotaxis protein CheW [Candidatus Delongbacteria bacterium]
MMDTIEERKLWRLENIINVLSYLSIELNIAASEVKQLGRGIGSVAVEIKKFMLVFERDVFNRLKFENVPFSGVEERMAELGSMLRLLSMNALLEAKRLNHSKAYILCDELRKIGESVQNILEISKDRKNLSMLNPDRTFPEPLPYVVFKIGGTYWAESMNSVMEAVIITDDTLKDYPFGSGKMRHHVVVRGIKMPVINLHSEMKEKIKPGKESRLIILNLGHILYGHTSSDLFFGLIVDEIEYCGFLQKAVQEFATDDKVPVDYVRYTWSAKDATLMFFNWDNIINEREIRDYLQIENKG